MIALLFPGQGSQYPGMGKSLYENFPQSREIFDSAGAVIGYDLKSKIFEGSEEELRQTAVTQPAIFTASCAAFKAFSPRFPALKARVRFAAGHSLGEYSALFAAGVFDFQTGLKLVLYRGRFLQECCDKHPGTMAAMIGFERSRLQTLCEESRNGGEGCLEMVNFNSPGQIVVAGSRESVEKLLSKASSIPGTKAVPLSVSGAFHSSLMKEASMKMSEALGPAALNNAGIAVIANRDAAPTIQAADIKRKLVEQIDHPVLWEETIRKMIDEGVETFIEIGPGKVLSGLLRKIDRKKRALNVEDAESLEKTLKELTQS